MMPETGSLPWRRTLKGEDLTKNRPLVKIYPAQVMTTVGARLWERKVAVAVRWLAVAAKDASDIPPGVTALPTDAFNVVNLYLDYRPNEAQFWRSEWTGCSTSTT